MKKQSSTQFSQLNREDLSSLTVIVKETLATDTSMKMRKTFSAADLWNIQSQKKTFTQRRFSF